MWRRFGARGTVILVKVSSDMPKAERDQDGVDAIIRHRGECGRGRVGRGDGARTLVAEDKDPEGQASQAAEKTWTQRAGRERTKHIAAGYTEWAPRVTSFPPRLETEQRAEIGAILASRLVGATEGLSEVWHHHDTLRQGYQIVSGDTVHFLFRGQGCSRLCPRKSQEQWSW